MTLEQEVKYLLSRSDVEAALLLLKEDHHYKLLSYIHQYWPSMFGEYDRVYKEAGEVEAKNIAAFAHIPNEGRFQWLLNYLKNHPELRLFYNYGASRCLYDIHLQNEVGGKFYCEDIDETSINEARSFIKMFAHNPKYFVVKAAKTPMLEDDREVDCVICMEVLEHVLDPVSTLEDLEDNIKEGGKMIISVPYGPVEYTMWQNTPHRNREHIREFNMNELLQLFEFKEDVEFHQLSYGINQQLGMEVGCNIICYTVTEEGRGFDGYEVDLAGKLAETKDVELPGLGGEYGRV